MNNLSEEYVPALIKVLKVLGTDKIPKHVYPSFRSFMDLFDPSPYEHLDLKVLYDFSRKVGCKFTWLTKLNDVTYLVVDPTTLTEPESGHIVDSFLSQLSLFSPSFFSTFEQVMSHPSN
jgi:hypothetical protein